MKWIVVNRLENWRKSEMKNAQVSHKQTNQNNKNLKTYHYHYLMRTGLSLSYRYVILKFVWNELSSTDWKIDVRVKWKKNAKVSRKQKNTNKNTKNLSLSLPNEDWVKPQLRICYSKIRLKWIVVNRLKNWRKSEMKKKRQNQL